MHPTGVVIWGKNCGDPGVVQALEDLLFGKNRGQIVPYGGSPKMVRVIRLGRELVPFRIAEMGVPDDPCTQAGDAPDPGWYVGQVRQAAQRVPATELDSANELINRTNQLGKLLEFRRGGTLDAQPSGASPAYGNYVFGASLSGAGFSLSATLSAANAYALVSGAQYHGQAMSPDYPFIPAANVANITNGYYAQQFGVLCHK